MNTKKFVIYLISLVFAAESFAATICEGDNFRQMQAQNGTFTELAALFLTTGKKSKLHIFGEEHFYTNRDLLTIIISQAAPRLSGIKKCLFLEIPKGGLDLFAERFRAMQSQVKSPADQAKLDMFSKYYPSIVQAAASHNMMVYEIDHPEHLLGTKPKMKEIRRWLPMLLDYFPTGNVIVLSSS